MKLLDQTGSIRKRLEEMSHQTKELHELCGRLA